MPKKTVKNKNKIGPDAVIGKRQNRRNLQHEQQADKSRKKPLFSFLFFRLPEHDQHFMQF